MQTDSVARMNQVMLLLRQQLLSRAGRDKTKPSLRAAGGAKATGHGARSERGSLSRVVSLRLDTLRNAGVTNPQLLKRAFVEQLLVSGFGDQMMNDAKFQEMVDEVLSTLQHDPELAELLRVVTEAKGR
jgi:hypothetical protein